MLPSGGYLSTVPQAAAFEEAQGERGVPLVDVELGGVALNDSSAGLKVKLWTLRYEAGDFIVSADGVPDTVLFSAPDVTQLALAFDQNMAPFVAYMEAGQPRFRWYDARVTGYVVVDLPADCVDLRACMDDKRLNQRAASDIILAYLRGTNLYYRQQRDRFAVEHLLASNLNARLLAIGMNTANRLQFQLRPTQ